MKSRRNKKIKSRKHQRTRNRIKRRTRKIVGRGNKEISVTPEEIISNHIDHGVRQFEYIRKPDFTKFLFKNNKLSIEKITQENEIIKTVTKTIKLNHNDTNIWIKYSEEYNPDKVNTLHINGVITKNNNIDNNVKVEVNSTEDDWNNYLFKCEKIIPEEIKTVRTFIDGRKKDMIIESKGKLPVKIEYKNGQPLVTKPVHMTSNPRQINL